MSNLNLPHFQDKDKAREYLEAIRWPNGPVCPHCGSSEGHYQLQGKSHRPGVWKCKDCREQFTVTVGTVFERSKIALNVWLQAVFLLCSSKKGMSAKQLERMLGVTYKTAWFMAHRIREAMTNSGGLLGGNGGIVEIDETYIGVDKTKPKPKQGPAQKRKVLSLVDRTTGRSRSMVMTSFKKKDLWPVLMANVDRNTNICTDESAIYSNLKPYFRGHASVNHSRGEYVAATNPNVHTNTIEGYFSIFKRGMKGIYQHCGHPHLNRYLAEFDFRYSTREKLGFDDTQRTVEALKGISGKRLMYRPTSAQ